jgi:hypothetical protein
MAAQKLSGTAGAGASVQLGTETWAGGDANVRITGTFAGTSAKLQYSMPDGSAGADVKYDTGAVFTAAGTSGVAYIPEGAKLWVTTTGGDSGGTTAVVMYVQAVIGRVKRQGVD